MFLAQRLASNLRMRHLAATYIQKIWKGYHVRKWYQDLKANCIEFQARVRGNILRQRYQHLLEEHRSLMKQKDVCFSTPFLLIIKIHILQSFMNE